MTSEKVVGKGTILTGTNPSPGLRGTVIQIPDKAAKPSVPEGYALIDDLLAELASDEVGRVAIAEARKELAEDALAAEGPTFRARRLELGLSQAALAALIGTRQPHIARIERGTENLHLDTCRRLCVALDVDMNTLDRLLERQEQAGMRNAG